jgi:hypothetical protein
LPDRLFPRGRRAKNIYDSSTSLFAHLAQLIFPATPDAAKIDRSHASNSSLLASAISVTGLCTPALLNTASNCPNVETLCSTIAATWTSAATSQRTASALWPAETSPLKKGGRLLGNRADVRQGDVTDARSIRAALTENYRAIFFTVAATGGIDRRGLFGSKTMIRQVTYQGLLNVVDAARSSGFEGRIMLSSVEGADLLDRD